MSTLIAAAVSGAIALGVIGIMPRGQESVAAEPETAGPEAVEPEPAGSASIDRQIHRYIVEHPEVIAEAIAVLQARQEQREIETARQRIVQNHVPLYEDPGSLVEGSADADVTIVEFFDYNCPYCKRAHPILTALRADDPGVRFIYKEFPVLGPISVLAARAALASRKQGKYAEFHEALISQSAKLTADDIWREAADLGLDIEQLRADMTGKDIDQIIERNFELARRMNVKGTPSFVIGEVFIPGFVDRAYLDAVIAETRANQSLPSD